MAKNYFGAKVNCIMRTKNNAKFYLAAMLMIFISFKAFSQKNMYRYFPENTFENHSIYERYSNILDKLDPESIKNLSAGENAVRFIKINEPYYYVIKIMWTEKDLSMEFTEENEFKNLHESGERNITRESLNEILRLIEKGKFYEMKSDVDNSDLTEGYMQLIETNINGKYKAVERWWPESGAFYSIGENIFALYKGEDITAKKDSWNYKIKKSGTSSKKEPSKEKNEKTKNRGL